MFREVETIGLYMIITTGVCLTLTEARDISFQFDFIHSIMYTRPRMVVLTFKFLTRLIRFYFFFFFQDSRGSIGRITD